MINPAQAKKGAQLAFKSKRFAASASAGGVGAAGVAAAAKNRGSEQTQEQREAVRADNTAAVAGTASAVGAIGGVTIRKARPAAFLAKNRGIAAVLAGVATGAGAVAAHNVSQRDRAAGTSNVTRRADTAKAFVGFGVKPSQPPQPRTVRAVNKGRAEAKNREPRKPVF